MSDGKLDYRRYTGMQHMVLLSVWILKTLRVVIAASLENLHDL